MRKGKLRILDDWELGFYCPGCKEYHFVHVRQGNEHPSWTFNENYDLPTFSPSILVRSGHYVPGSNPDECWCNFKERFPEEGDPPFHCVLCHSFVTNGKIQFLPDCSHELAGQTVDMVDITEDE